MMKPSSQTSIRRSPKLLQSALRLVTSLIAVALLVEIGFTARARSAYLAGDTAVAAWAGSMPSDVSAALGARERDAGRLENAARLARSAIDTSPFNAAGPVLLAMIDQDEGQEAKADRLIDLAARLGWRDSETQYLLAYRALERGDYPGFMLHSDAMLRQGVAKEILYSALRRASVIPAARTALAARLGTDPNWRGDYLRDLAAIGPDDYTNHAALLRQLATTPQPASKEEVNAFANRLISNQRYALAQQIAGEIGQKSFGGVTTNASFAGLLADRDTRGPFDWVLSDVSGAEVTVEPLPDRTGRIGVHIIADGPAEGSLLKQMIVSPAGGFELEWTAIERRSGSIAALTWQVRCNGSGQIKSGVQRAIRRSGGNMLIMLSFEVPSTNCPAQTIELFLHNRADQKLDIWIN